MHVDPLFCCCCCCCSLAVRLQLRKEEKRNLFVAESISASQPEVTRQEPGEASHAPIMNVPIKSTITCVVGRLENEIAAIESVTSDD